ncbi:24272_t:CDS:1 [Dentiscutata erythropus]|uniref:24272_t:CDS:1 n=1 Tax=Dentiscutata erythropus TaxID=1348616 RepID=A0A9N9EML9_9GLOM|nr:24272_t:CDS:1 [Dentiscutata erythropus]
MTFKIKIETKSSMRQRINKPKKKRPKRNGHLTTFALQQPGGTFQSPADQIQPMPENDQSRQQSQVNNYQSVTNQVADHDQSIIHNTQYVNSLNQQSQVHNIQQFETNQETMTQLLDQQFVRIDIPVENFAGLNFPVQNLIGKLVGLNVSENLVEIYILPTENIYYTQIQAVDQDQTMSQTLD